MRDGNASTVSVTLTEAIIASTASVILTKRATASGWKDLGQLRLSEAGTAFESLRPLCNPDRSDHCEHSLCHPDEASNASGRKDLGQLRASEAGTGFESPRPTFFRSESGMNYSA
ncbi:MAG: hypothetical protein WCA22_16340 [Candidatus Binatus sp.]